MKIILAVLAGLFIFSRLQQGQGSTGFSAAPAGWAGGEIPFGGAAGIIENFLSPVFPGDGGGGAVGTRGGATGVTAGATFPRLNVRYRAATGPQF
jgi:hypothetical protein